MYAQLESLHFSSSVSNIEKNISKVINDRKQAKIETELLQNEVRQKI